MEYKEHVTILGWACFMTYSVVHAAGFITETVREAPDWMTQILPAFLAGAAVGIAATLSLAGWLLWKLLYRVKKMPDLSRS